MTSTRPRLLFVHPSDELYGADRMLLEMLDALGADADVEVWLPDDLDHPAAEMALCTALAARGVQARHEPLPILRRAYQSPGGLLLLLRRSARLVRRMRAHRPDIVYCTTSAAMLGAPLARLARVPRVVGHFQEIWSRSDSVALSGPAASCHTRLAISDAVVAGLPSRLRSSTVVVPNATPDPGPRAEPGGGTGPLRFLVASRWNGWKGHRTLLDAWNRAGAPGRLVVLGGPPLSGDTVDVRALAAELDDPTSVDVVGEVTDSGRYLDESDVVIMPSDQPEPFGLVAIEAFARGRPVIGSAAGGLVGILTPGSDGWLFPPRDAAALASVLTSIDHEAVTRAGRAARQTYDARFTPAHFARAWRSVVLPDHVL